MYTKRAELKAGLVVLAGVVAVFAFLYFGGGAEPIWGDYRYVHVRFEPGFLAPKVGDDLKMNGARIGRVDEVRQGEDVYLGDDLTPELRARLGIRDPAVNAARELYILAVVKLPADQIIPRGTTVLIDASIIGTRTLSLLPGYSLDNLSDAEIRASPLPAQQAPGIAEITEKLSGISDKVDTLVTGGTELIADARDVMAVLKQKISVIDTQGISDDARAGVAALRRTLEGLETRIAPIADKVESAATNLDRMTATGADAVAQVKTDLAEILATLKNVAARVDRIVLDAQPKVAAFLDDLNAVGKNLVRLSQEVQGIGPEARAILADLGYDAKQLMKSLKDTGHNLLDASEDLRANPWKLLNEPSADEIAFENLRNATLNYERAMRELNEASARLTKLLAKPPTGDANARAAIAQALQNFQAQLASVRRTERRFVELLQSARK